ncbi:MAG TPA: YqgE/AlgH family protein [Bryobacteraceae bacterium]|nr:YqgE/AlgH family protein [Bryobacteraceae bacterium]
MAPRGLLLAGLAALACALPAAAQSTNSRDLATGKFLVANRGLADPNFSETVVLLVAFDENGVVGLVVNRRTKLPVSTAIAIQEAKHRPEPVYYGGPVELEGVMALARSSAAIEGAKHVVGDVYLIVNKQLLDKSLASPISSSAFHIFLGYAGWSAPQLRNELRQGGWYIFPGDSSLVFDGEPGTVWDRLIAKAEVRFALFTPPTYAPR